MLSWGEVTHQDLGLVNPRDDVLYSTGNHSHFFLRKTKIIWITAGNGLVAFIWENGNVSLVRFQDQQGGKINTTKKRTLVMKKEKVKAISCGADHVVLLSERGIAFHFDWRDTSNVPRWGGLVFTFGSGCYGQLGHNSVRDELRPRLVAELWGSTVSQIACGRHHTLTLVSSNEKVYAFGRGENGQLGTGLRRNLTVPVPVHMLLEYKTDQRIERIMAGGNQSFAFFVPAHGSASSSGVPPPGPGLSMPTLDDAVIERWTSAVDETTWRKIKKEILKTFSSATSINGSFLEKSGDAHYQTSLEWSGLDLSLARLAFQKLAKNEKVLAQVEFVAEHTLLPSLTPTPAGVEVLRVYLILPELLRVLCKQGRGQNLAVAFSIAVFKLSPDWLTALEGLWSKLPGAFFKTLVTVFHSVSKWFLARMRAESCNHWNSLKKTAGLLQMLFEVNSQTVNRIEDSEFCMDEITNFFKSLQFLTLRLDLLQDVNEIKSLLKKIKAFLENINSLISCPCIFDMKAKCGMFSLDQVKLQMQSFQHLPERNLLRVNRHTMLMDAILELRDKSKCNYNNYRGTLQVKFEEEDGFDDGGLSQEFFTILAKELCLLEPRVLEINEESGLVWFIPKEQNCITDDTLYLVGILCGMALYNGCVVNFGFPLALFKKLLGKRPTMADLKELSPTEAQGLQNLLDEDEELVEDLYLDFTAKGHELVPHGREIIVNKFNRKQYLDAYVDFVFNKSVQGTFADFEQGFSQGCPSKMWRLFLPEELMAVLYGNDTYEWENLKENATYDGYEANDETIQNFWAVFTELSEQQKKAFLTFMTGTDRLRVGGLSRMNLTIVRTPTADADYRFPVAQTCYGRLLLPNYSSVDTLREKFVHAISHSRSFGAL